jgi:hypothetical protein
MHDKLNKDFSGPERTSNVIAVYTDQFKPSLQSAKPIPGRIVEGCRSAAILNFSVQSPRDGGPMRRPREGPKKCFRLISREPWDS